MLGTFMEMLGVMIIVSLASHEADFRKGNLVSETNCL